jgi:hypothetical protein
MDDSFTEILHAAARFDADRSTASTRRVTRFGPVVIAGAQYVRFILTHTSGPGRVEQTVWQFPIGGIQARIYTPVSKIIEGLEEGHKVLDGKVIDGRRRKVHAARL